MKPVPSTSYLDEAQLPYKFCPGCGHKTILEALNEAFSQLRIDPHNLVIVTDIGCAGLSDRYFSTNAFHGLHGRSTTYATGIKLANPNLHVVVLIGDGGCGIGGHHLINAARRNIGVTTIVFNNLNYGMTGGEHSVTTPIGARTATTQFGQLESPLDICGSVAINGASFVARSTTFDKKLPELITKAIQNDGFSLVDVWELCTAHFVPRNRFSKKSLENKLEELEFQTGIIKNQKRPEYSRAYRDIHAEMVGKPALSSNPIKPSAPLSLKEKIQIILAGAAGAKINSAASLFGEGGMISGLWVTQRDDYPVTVKSGHSISEIILSHDEIHFTGISKPDVMLVLFPQGLEKSWKMINQLTPEDVLILSAGLSQIASPAQKIIIDFKSSMIWGGRKEYWAVMALAILLEKMKYYPLKNFKESIATHSRYASENLAAIEASKSLKMQVI